MTAANLAKLITHTERIELELSAYYTSISVIPHLVTYSVPYIIDADFYTSFHLIHPISQSNLSFSTTLETKLFIMEPVELTYYCVRPLTFSTLYSSVIRMRTAIKI